jgi:phosphoribosylanthranilate isomerase
MAGIPSPTPEIKICGNRDPKMCVQAAKAGATMLGFIFVSGSKRCVSLDLAAECILTVKAKRQAAPSMVGVFVDEESSRINEIAWKANLDYVQLHGNEPPAQLAEIIRPVIKVIRPRTDQPFDEVRNLIESYLTAPNIPCYILIDGFDSRVQGGAGIRADWDLAAELSKSYPIMLAGGLHPENVHEAIEKVVPRGVDVSSGVETDEVRDPLKVESFITNARIAFRYGNHVRWIEGYQKQSN